jgi:hypothetical protein
VIADKVLTRVHVIARPPSRRVNLTKIRFEEEQAKHHKMETIYDDKTMYRAGHKLAEEITIMAIQGLDGEWQGILPG